MLQSPMAKTMTFIAGLRHYGMTAPWVLDGPMDGPAFITYIKTQLAPTLQKGDVVVTACPLTRLPQPMQQSGSAAHGCYSCHHIRRT